jgi:peptidoglycan hydrolase-like protein with peptidoglycan-binding domain
MQIWKRRVFARCSTLAAAGAMLVMPQIALARFGDRTLSTGSQGHDVRVLQSWLDKLGFSTGIDGVFGRHTRWALRRWEEANHLPVNGVLTRSDARRLRRALQSGYGSGGSTYSTKTAPGEKATMSSDGLHAVAPADAPPEIQEMIDAGNHIVGKPYKYGGGHGRWEDSGYDCSGTVSYVLHAAGMLSSPLTSGGLESWGSRGRSSWATVYANSGHAYIIIAGLRLDTSGDSSGTGPRWHTDLRSGSGYVVRHWSGL